MIQVAEQREQEVERAVERSFRVPQHVRAVIGELEGVSAAGNPATSFPELSVKSDDLIALLARLNPEAIAAQLTKGILPINISDFDGTLIRDSSGGFKIDYAIDNGFILPVIREELNGMMVRFGLQPKPSGFEDTTATVGTDVRAVKEAFEVWVKRTDVSADEKNENTKAFYQMCSWIFAGHTKEEMHDFTERVLTDTGYGVNYFKGAREVIGTLSALGIQTLLVSATFQPVVEVAARYFGIPEWAVVGMNLETDSEGRYTTEAKEPVTFRGGKVQAAELLMSRYTEVHGLPAGQYWPLLAMGDSPSKTDEQLLAMAQVAVAVEPQTPKDAEHAKKLFAAGRPGFFLDFTETIAGEPANKFRSELEVQEMPKGKFL